MSNTFFILSINSADIMNGIPSPIEYDVINRIPLIVSLLLDINNNADAKNVPIHGVQLIENAIPKIKDLKKFKSLTFDLTLFSLFKNLSFIISI